MAILIWLLFSLLFITAEAQRDPRKRKLICYFNSGSNAQGYLNPERVDASYCTHINYNFAILNEATYQIDYADQSIDLGEGYYEKVTSLKNQHEGLKVLLSIGGWLDSTYKYSTLVSDANLRLNFARHAVQFLQQHNFDGLDVAWEFPNCWQGNCGINPDDKPNFILFLQDLRMVFNETNLLLTASVSGTKVEIDAGYNVPDMSEILDHINVMAFDWHGGWENKTGHHAQFEPLPDYDTYPDLNVVNSMSYWVDQGADPRKLILGIPAYGRSFTLRDRNNSWFYDDAIAAGNPGRSTVEAGYLAYHEICRLVKRQNWKEQISRKIGAYAVQEDQWVGYDAPINAVLKARYVLRKRFGGAAYKNFYSDDFSGNCYSWPFPILASIHYGLYFRQRKAWETDKRDMEDYMKKIKVATQVIKNYNVVDEVKSKDRTLTDDDVYLHVTMPVKDDHGTHDERIEIHVGDLTYTVMTD